MIRRSIGKAEDPRATGKSKLSKPNKKNLSVQKVLAIFEALPSDDDSAASNNSDTDYEDYVENVPQGENISSDDEEIDECSVFLLPNQK
ncbi:hypothetical protein TNCV_1162571 [Trichonephila clavipes]|nr:hypothetical protein TNCV_1162571 [Trichonephila clavipes]